jgi:hypothetical protein
MRPGATTTRDAVGRDGPRRGHDPGDRLLVEGQVFGALAAGVPVGFMTRLRGNVSRPVGGREACRVAVASRGAASPFDGFD